jgi:hypothetical protein
MLPERFASHRAYGEATITDVLGPLQSRARKAEATTLASMVFLNRGDHFEAEPMPREAQWAPAFGVSVADFDGDGLEDVFLAQNFFALPAETSRLDAGRGLLLRGGQPERRAPARHEPGVLHRAEQELGAPDQGAGPSRSAESGLHLTPMSRQQSGIEIYGEQRGVAVADYDADGRVDLVVAQNGTATKLFHNVAGRAGLRVRLAGPAGNPAGVGTQIRLKFGERFGPAREVHGGSGYWSQDDAVQVLGGLEAPTHVWVRWPGGAISTVAVPADASKVTVAYQGMTGRQ